jgi:hypothetical protein
MFLLYNTRMHFIMAPDYQRHWYTKIEALDWAREQGFNMAEIVVCPVIFPDN